MSTEEHDCLVADCQEAATELSRGSFHELDQRIGDQQTGDQQTFWLCDQHRCTVVTRNNKRCPDLVWQGEIKEHASAGLAPASRKRRRKDVSTCLYHQEAAEATLKRNSKTRPSRARPGSTLGASASESSSKKTMYLVGKADSADDSEIVGLEVTVKHGCTVLLPDQDTVPAMTQIGPKLKQLIRDHEDKVMSFNSSEKRRPILAAMIDQKAAGDVGHHIGVRRGSGGFMEAYRKHCIVISSSAGVSQVVKQCLAGTKQTEVASIQVVAPPLFPDHHCESRVLAGLSQPIVEQYAEDFRRFEGWQTISTPGNLVETTKSGAALESKLLVGAELWFVGGVSMLVRSGDTVYLKPGIPYTIYTIEPSIRHSQHFINAAWISLVQTDEDISNVYLCLMALATKTKLFEASDLDIGVLVEKLESLLCVMEEQGEDHNPELVRLVKAGIAAVKVEDKIPAKEQEETTRDDSGIAAGQSGEGETSSEEERNSDEEDATPASKEGPSAVIDPNL